MDWQNVKKLANLFVHNYPKAYAVISSFSQDSKIEGGVYFYETELEDGKKGVFIVTEITGLPYETGACKENFLGCHIHEGKDCVGTKEEPFKNSGGHFNPEKCPHPAHAGDMPSLLNNQGTAVSVVLSTRFTVEDVIGRTVIIHAMADDFRTQPAGDSGEKIACGRIRRYMGEEWEGSVENKL